MNLVILIGLVVVGTAHAVRGTIRLLLPDRVSADAGRRDAILPFAGLGLSMVGLLVGWSAGLPVPIGYAGGNGSFALDPLGCLFSLLLFSVAACCDADNAGRRGAGGLRDLCVGATALVFLAGDAFLLSLGAILALLSPAGLLGRGTVRVRVLAAFAIAGACSLLSGLSAPVADLPADPGFALLRAGGGIAPDNPSEAILLPVLVVLAMLPLLGLFPFRSGFNRLCAFAPPWVPVTGMLLGLFLPLRLLLDLAGPVPSAGWGVLLVVLGAGSALRAGLSSLSDRRACGVIGDVLAVQNGLAVVAVGVCLLARSNDLPTLAGSALDAVMLTAPTCCLGGLACLGLARAMEAEAGSGLLSRLGGLSRSMPRTCLLMLAPLCLLGAVPPGCGFSAFWLLLQCVLATPMPLPGGIALPLLVLLSAVAVAMILGCCGLVRLCWIAALGRPRTPRGAAATDLGASALRRHGAVLVVPLLVGLLPGGWLGLAAGQAGDAAMAAGEGLRHPLFWLVSPTGTGTMAPLPVALLLILALVLTMLLARMISVRQERRQPDWNAGAAPPPAWLPFGDPATQIAPSTLIHTLLQALAQAQAHDPAHASAQAPAHALAQASAGSTSGSAVGGAGWRPAVGAARLRGWLRNGGHAAAAARISVSRHAPLLAAAVLALLLCIVATGAAEPGGPLR